MNTTENLKLTDGSRVAVMGCGPAGSFFTYFLLDMAERVGLDIHIDVYEPRDFTIPGPPGCNMCGGVISESLVQNLSTEGIILPRAVVQRGVDSYVLHTDVGSVRIDTPLHEKRIASVFRGHGPRDLKEFRWDSFDGHLQKLAMEKGAQMIRARVENIDRQDDRLAVTAKGNTQVYNLVAVTTGVNTAALKLIEKLKIDYTPPRTTKTFIREYKLGEETIAKRLGSSMHVFLLNLPRLEFAMLVPKGDYVTLAMLGRDIDNELVKTFVHSPTFANLMPPELQLDTPPCQCQPRMTVDGATQPYDDRIVFIGDCGVTRLYKDGIGAAYRAAKAAATTAIFEGISKEDFRRYYAPACRRMETDNHIGKVIFFATSILQRWAFARRAMVRMTAYEQKKTERPKRMSMVMWDMFTGSAPYREIFVRMLHPWFIARLAWDFFMSLVKPHEKVGTWSSKTEDS